MCKMVVVSRVGEKIVTDESYLMKKAGLDERMGYEGIGLQEDGTPVVFDKCGNFGYLDIGEFVVLVGFEQL